jgi:lipoprotein-releasing system ATP-binding protein
MSDVILQATNLRKAYFLGRVTLKVLKGVSLTAERGEFVAIMGSSGSGKSTLLHVLGALDVPDEGTVLFEQRDVFACSNAQRDRLRNAAFGFVFQFYHLLPELTVLENTVLPCMVGSSTLSWLSRERGQLRTGHWLERLWRFFWRTGPSRGRAHRRQAEQLLGRLGLGHRLGHRPNELSGGERQRVAIARALVNRPRVLLADEPTGNLDAATGREILGVLKALNDEGQTILMVTHDPQVAAAAHRIVYLVDGRVSARNQ